MTTTSSDQKKAIKAIKEMNEELVELRFHRSFMILTDGFDHVNYDLDSLDRAIAELIRTRDLMAEDYSVGGKVEGKGEDGNDKEGMQPG